MKFRYKKIQHLSEYLVFLFFSAWAPLLGRSRIFYLSRFFGRLGYYLLPRRRAVAETNLKLAFPEFNGPKRKSIIIKSFGNVALGILYILWLKKITREKIDSLVEVDSGSLDYMRRAFEKKRGVLVLVAHFGNWELMGVSYGYNDLPALNSIARKLDNPYLEKRLRQFRTASGNYVIHKKDASKGIIKALKRNECVALMLDHNVAKNEVFVDFFGKKAATTRSLASLALATGVPIIPATSYPLEDGRFRTVYGPEIKIDQTGDKKKDILSLTQKCTGHIQEKIRECPEGWMWGHRRWKKRPKGEPPIY